MPLKPDPTPDSTDRSTLVHREILKLSALILLAVGSFLMTRAFAASNRRMSLRDAAEWYRRGQQSLDAGRVDEAIDSLRRATVRDRDEKRYDLTLARALALKGDDEAARNVLLTLRDSAPEDADINLQLARLAATRQDVTEALRFYHNALYAPWPIEQADARRRVRVEVIRFLLTHGQTSRALSELLALSSDMPEDAAARVEVAQLFADAGDHTHALDQFQRALTQSPDDGTATAGAGLAAFRLGDYALARTYLHQLPTPSADVQRIRETVDLVLSSDPLASRLGSTERRRRLTADLSHTEQRLSQCGESPDGAPPEGLVVLRGEAQAFTEQLAQPGILEQDTVEAGVDLINREEREIARRCGPPTVLDQALALIGHAHGTDSK